MPCLGKALDGHQKMITLLHSMTPNTARCDLQGMRVSEFVMSNELVSMTLAMVSESREVNTILKELFTPEGNELYVHPASRYLRWGGTSHTLKEIPTEMFTPKSNVRIPMNQDNVLGSAYLSSCKTLGIKTNALGKEAPSHFESNTSLPACSENCCSNLFVCSTICAMPCASQPWSQCPHFRYARPPP